MPESMTATLIGCQEGQHRVVEVRHLRVDRGEPSSGQTAVPGDDPHVGVTAELHDDAGPAGELARSRFQDGIELAGGAGLGPGHSGAQNGQDRGDD